MPKFKTGTKVYYVSLGKRTDGVVTNTPTAGGGFPYFSVENVVWAIWSLPERSGYMENDSVFAVEPEFTIGWKHGHQTIGGVSVRVLPQRVAGRYSVVLAVPSPSGQEYLMQCDTDGCLLSTNGRVVNKPSPKKAYYVHVFLRGGNVYSCMHVDQDQTKVPINTKGRVHLHTYGPLEVTLD